MHLPKGLLAVIAVTLIVFSAGLRGQGFVDGIKVTLPEPVTLADEKVLQPGEYEIRRASQFQDQILRIFNNDKMVYEATVITIPTLGEKTPEDSKVVLHHIGDNYYFDKIWIQGKDYGYEFRLPARAEALQRELAVNVPAKYEAVQASSQAPAVHEGPGLAEQLEAVAAQQERDRQEAALTQPQDQNDRVDQVAALQSDPAPQTNRPQSVAQNDANIPERLPETATNWVAFLVAGFFLITLSLVFRARVQRQE